MPRPNSHIIAAAIAAVVLLLSLHSAQAAEPSAPLTVNVIPAPAVSFNPPGPINVPCNTPPGTVLSTATATGGSGSPFTMSCANDCAYPAAATADTTLDGTANPAKVIIAPAGVLAAHCPAGSSTTPETVTVTGTNSDP